MTRLSPAREDCGKVEPRVHERRVSARIHLADRRCLVGQLCSDPYNSDGRAASIIDRLNDAGETFLPLARKNEQYLLHKSNIVSVELGHAVIDIPLEDGLRELRINASLLTGSGYHGALYAHVPAGSRLLDYLNELAQAFIPIWTKHGVVLVNVDYIVSVVEDLAEDGGV